MVTGHARGRRVVAKSGTTGRDATSRAAALTAGTGKILREYRCLGHGSFEAYEPVCPYGCTTVEREYLTAPAMGNAKTAATDTALKALAADYGLTDLKNGAGSVMASLRQRPTSQPMWGSIPKVAEGEGGHAVGGLLSSFQTPATNMVEAVKTGFNLQPPKAHVVGADKQRLVTDSSGDVRVEGLA